MRKKYWCRIYNNSNRLNSFIRNCDGYYIEDRIQKN